MKILIKTILVTAFLSINLCAQEYNQFDNTTTTTLSSPDVYNFEKYSLNSVNHYVGKVDISLPIYTIKTGGIEYPINLVYDSGGIKVDQISSDVGLGWSLTNTIITRNINSDNDFDNTGNLNKQSDYNSYSEADKLDDYPSMQKKIGYFLQHQFNISLGYASVDFIPDTYHFYTNGLSTEFFFKDVNTPVETNPKGTKIEAVPSKRRIDTKRGYDKKVGPNSYVWTQMYIPLSEDFYSIFVTTDKGIKYTFTDCDYAMVQYGTKPQVSAWHISKIEDLNTGKKIDFVYEDTSSNPNDISNSQPINLSFAQRSYGYTVAKGYAGIPSSYDIYTVPTIKIDVLKKRLKKIVFDEGELHFNYNNLGVVNTIPFIRTDLYNSDCLTQIYLKNNNAENIKSFNLEYDYFVSTHNVGEFNPDNGLFNSYRYTRLKLLNFGEKGKPKTKFTYNENIRLPPINSYSIDFLGYFNNSQDKPIIGNDHPYPTLYYYPNQFEKSLLPFNVISMNPIVFPGYFNREANEYSKTWSLNKIEFPTGGSVEYTYESNQFEEFGENIKGGGIRIVEQKINDGKGGVKRLNYSYIKNGLLTSGKLSAIPYFGYPEVEGATTAINYPNIGEQPATIVGNNIISSANDTWIFFDKSNLNADITSGAYVGYSKVIESEVGNGRKEFDFTSSDILGFKNVIYRTPPEFSPVLYSSIFDYDLIYQQRAYVPDPNQQEILYYDISYLNNGRINNLIANSALNTNFFTDKSYKRGKLLEKRIYNESNKLIQKTNINYSDFFIESNIFYQGFLEPGPFLLTPPGNGCYFCIPRPIRRMCITQSCMQALMVSKKDILVSQFLPLNKTITNYDEYGNTKTENLNYIFNQKGFLKTVEKSINNSDIQKIKYFFPQDIELINEPFKNDLILSNKIGIPLKTEVYINNEKLSEQKTVYAKDLSTNNLLLPKYVLSKKGADSNSILENKITYNTYDSNGTLLQQTLENGIAVCIIWGYNKTLPIARIENIQYSAIPANLITAVQNASNLPNNEANLLIALDAIRNDTSLVNAMVTTYTHIPLVGVSTVTDAKKDKITYSYDILNRLKFVKDKNGKILSENEYNYKPQN